MKILYAVQATGNGHLSRAKAIIAILQKYGTVDIAVSGTQSDVKLPFPIQYQKQGTSFIYGNRGGINWWTTFKNTHFFDLLKDIRQFPIENYDLIFNDFEPVVAWACKRKGVPCIGLSHQGAFLSDQTPRPKKRNFAGELVLKNFAPVAEMHAFHFNRYDDFIHTPVIRQDIRNAVISQKSHIAVYLPAVSNKLLIKHFSKVQNIEWKVFSRRVKTIEIEGNVTIYPVGNSAWIEAAASAEGVLMGAGFEGPAETLFMGKKLMVMPMIGQYEQLCNGTALEEMGVKMFRRIKPNFSDLLKDWLKNVPVIQVDYPDETAAIIDKIIQSKVSTSLNIQPTQIPISVPFISQ
jgi:uncharacterized protein (TIGR00661 family)